MRTLISRLMAAFLLLASCAWSAVPQATELTPMQARDILYVAYGQYHGPRDLLDYPPRINVVPAERLREKFPCAREHCAPILGLFDEASGEIYLLDALDFSTVYATTVLLHEYIHWFQGKLHGRIVDLNLDDTQRCLEIVEREREAYRIQYDVLVKAGDFMHAQSVRMVAGMVHC